MIGIIIGLLAIGLGVKAFTPAGLPLSRRRNLTGTAAQVIGVLCVLAGIAFVLDGIIGTASLLRLFGDR